MGESFDGYGGPASYLASAKTENAAIAGLTDTTTSRDKTRLFFTSGRSRERTDVVAQQLARGTCAGGTDHVAAVSVRITLTA